MTAVVHAQNQYNEGLVLPPVVRSEQIKFVDHTKFHEPGAWDALVESPYPERGPHRPNVKYPVPSNKQDEYLFLKYNYLKCRAESERLQGGSEGHAAVKQLISRAELVEKQIATNYEPMLKYYVRGYIGHELPFDEVMAWARKGLGIAIERFDIERGKNFKLYAFRGVRIYVSHAVDKLFRPIEREAWIAARTIQCDISKLPDPKSPFSFIEDHDRAIALEKVKQAIETLPPRERFVLTHHYGLDGNPPQALEDVARSLHVKRHNKGGASRQYAHQIEVRALERLRKRLLKYLGVW